MAHHTKDFRQDNFSSEVLNSQGLVLVDFWASWCGPCLALAPHLEALAEQYQGQVTIGKVNVDENQQIAAQYGIRSIPTLILFKDGKPVDQMVGAGSKAHVESFFKNHF